MTIRGSVARNLRHTRLDAILTGTDACATSAHLIHDRSQLDHRGSQFRHLRNHRRDSPIMTSQTRVLRSLTRQQALYHLHDVAVTVRVADAVAHVSA